MMKASTYTYPLTIILFSYRVLFPFCTFVCVPLCHRCDDYCAVIRSVVEIWKFMSRYHGNKVLMGDLNTEPHSHTIRYMGESFVPLSW